MFKKLVMYCPQLENDAKLYAEKYGCEICPIAWNKFDENFPHIIIGDDDFSKSDVILFVSLDDYDSIFRQLSTIYALPRYRTRSFTIAMPLSSYKKLGEKVDAGVVDLKVVMHYLLNFVPFSTDGPAKIVSYVKDEDDLYFSK